MYTSSEVLARVKRVYRTEGLGPLLLQGVTHVLSRLFEYRTYYLSVARTDDVGALDEASFTPKTDDFTVHIVQTNREADELEAQGFEFRSCALNSRERLDKGAIASCIFIGRELGHVGWAAVTREAMNSLMEPPLRMDFSKNEGYRGGTWTHPKYRRMRLGVHGMLTGRRLLRDRGVEMVRTAMLKDNTITQRLMGKFTATFYAEGRYLRVLWWKQWWESPLSEPPAAIE